MKLHPFLEDRSGSALTLTGLAIAMMMASAAIAVDMGYAYVIKTRLQGTADFAAMAGSTELPDEDAVRIRAQAYAALNMPPKSNGTVLADNDVTIGNWNADTRAFTANLVPLNAVRVVTRRSEDNGNPLGLFFARALGVVDVNVNRMAIATNSGDGGPCVLTLNDSGSGIYANTNSSITADSCNIHSNSPDSDSIVTKGSGQITANNAEICAAGDYQGSGYAPAPTTGCSTEPDPLASLSPPVIPPCDHTDRVVVQDGDVETLYPGRYCKGLEINSGGVGNFEPGTYIIEGDKFTVNADSTAQGSGVTFYMEDKDALVLFNQNSQVDFSAPTDGDFAGILMYVNREIGELTKHEINSDSTSMINGAVYMPEAELMINSDGQMGGPGACSTYIVGNLYVNADSSLYVDQDFGSCGVPPAGGTGSVVQLVR